MFLRYLTIFGPCKRVQKATPAPTKSQEGAITVRLLEFGGFLGFLHVFLHVFGPLFPSCQNQPGAVGHFPVYFTSAKNGVFAVDKERNEKVDQKVGALRSSIIGRC
jgi:hypothetical protein